MVIRGLEYTSPLTWSPIVKPSLYEDTDVVDGGVTKNMTKSSIHILETMEDVVP